MKRTVRWPPDLTAGGLAMTASPDDELATPEDRTEALRQLIRAVCLDGTSGNPWNEADRIGTPDQTFAPNNAATAGAVEGRVREHFRKLEGRRRAKLASLALGPDPADRSRLMIVIEYFDLEAGRREKLEVVRANA